MASPSPSPTVAELVDLLGKAVALRDAATDRASRVQHYMKTVRLSEQLAQARG